MGWLQSFARRRNATMPNPAVDVLGAASLVKETPVSLTQAPAYVNDPLPSVVIPPRPLIFTSGFIRAGFPRCDNPDAWANAFTQAAERFPAFNRAEWACIFAKVKTEAMGLTRWDEDLYYSTVAQITKMHGSRAGTKPETLTRNPVKLGNQVYAKWGGYPARGLGTIQLTGLANHQAFASFVGLPLEAARSYMLTIPGAALTAPWYLSHYNATETANNGDMLGVMAVVAGKSPRAMGTIWDAIHGDKQVADFRAFRDMLEAMR